jgi:hypothetical protein
LSCGDEEKAGGGRKGRSVGLANDGPCSFYLVLADAGAFLASTVPPVFLIPTATRQGKMIADAPRV